jgi:hypothetical protein
MTPHLKATIEFITSFFNSVEKTRVDLTFPNKQKRVSLSIAQYLKGQTVRMVPTNIAVHTQA